MAIQNWQAEIVELHEVFEAYFLGAISELSRAEAVLAPDFSFVSTDSNTTDREGTLAAIAAGHAGANSMTIRTLDHQLILESDGILVAEYIEEHILPERTNSRRSTVVFSTTPDAPNGLHWRRVHETWIDRGL